jgi:hypothetical protein
MAMKIIFLRFAIPSQTFLGPRSTMDSIRASEAPDTGSLPAGRQGFLAEMAVNMIWLYVIRSEVNTVAKSS